MAAGTRNYGSTGSSFDQFKGAFFNTQAVVGAMDKADHRAQSKFGAFCRRRAQTSIRYRIAPSAPGSPPSGHKSMMRVKTNKRTGITKRQEVSPLREFIFFAYDRATKTTVIGPVLLNKPFSSKAGKPLGGTIPETLEKGGPITILELIRASKRERVQLRGKEPTRRRTVMIQKRPTMALALAAELPKLAEFYRNSL